METKIYDVLSRGELTYPMDAHIADNLPKINEMSEKLAEVLITEYFKHMRVNKITLYCRGSSGAILSALVSNYLIGIFPNVEISICHIKKDGEKSHSGTNSLWISNMISHVSIIIDDFIATGTTIIAIVDQLRKYNGDTFKPDILCVTGSVSNNISEKFKTIICSE